MRFRRTTRDELTKMKRFQEGKSASYVVHVVIDSIERCTQP